jgi:hypothetical protein
VSSAARCDDWCAGIKALLVFLGAGQYRCALTGRVRSLLGRADYGVVHRSEPHPDEDHEKGTVPAGGRRCPSGGAEGIRTPDLLIAKAWRTCTGSSALVRTVHEMPSARGRGCAGGARFSQGQRRATDPITSPHARRCSGSRVAAGHRAATRSALDAERRRANPRTSGRRLGGQWCGAP